MKRVRIRRGALLELEEQRRQEEADAAWAKMEADARKLEATLPPASSSGPLVFSPEQSASFTDAVLNADYASRRFLAATRWPTRTPEPLQNDQRGLELLSQEGDTYLDCNPDRFAADMRATMQGNPCIDIALRADRTAVELRRWSHGAITFQRDIVPQRDEAVDAMLFALACTEDVQTNSRPTLTTILPSVERPEWPKTVLGRFMSRISTYFPPRLVGMVPLVAQEAAECDKMIAEVASHEEKLKAATPQEVSLSTESLSFALDPSLPELDTSYGNALRDFVQDRIARDLRRIIGGLEEP